MRKAIWMLSCLLGLVVAQSGRLLDGFEGMSEWKAGIAPTYADSSATGVQPSSANATQGKQSLELRFDKAEKPKAIFVLEKPFDLSGAKGLSLDVFNPGTASSIALALSTGAAWEWHESDLVSLKSGAQTITFDLSGSRWKAARSNWELSLKLANPSEVKRLAVLVFPGKGGSLFVDNLRTSDTPATPTVGQTQTEAVQVTLSVANEVKPFTTLTLKPLTSEAGQFGRLEFALETDGVVPNPFDPAQADLSVRLTSPSGKTVTVPAFWYQDFGSAPIPPPGWRARFVPAEAGAWKAVALLAQSSLESAPVGFTVSTRKARGFVRVNKQNPRYFAFDSGEFFLPIGLNLGWSTGDVLGEYRRWLDRLSANGGNVARVWMASWSFGLEWNDTGLGDYTKRLRRAWLLDEVFKMAEERGVYLILCLLNHGAFSATTNPEWEANPYNAKNGGMLNSPEGFVTNPAAKELFKRRVRYIAARYAANTSLWAWEWWNEVNWTPIGDELLKPWVAEMSDHLAQFDPYGHLVSSSYSTGADSSLWKLPQIGFAQQHDYTERDLALHYAGLYPRIAESAPGKPLLPAELGYSASGADDTLVNREGLHLHNGLWVPVFMGYAGTGMYWWWDTLIDPKNLWPTYKGLATFVKSENLAALRPSKPTLSNPLEAVALGLQSRERALVWVRSNSYHAAEANQLYTLALLDGEVKPGWQIRFPLLRGLSLTVKGLGDGGYVLRWFNPRTATWIGQRTLEVKGGQAQIRVPDLDKDIALKLEKVK